MVFCPVPKFREGQQPVQIERRQRSASRRTREEKAKDRVRVRDGHKCRFPGCKEPYAIHVAHLDDKGMGGDKRGYRSQPHLMLCLCWLHHEGPRSVHSKDIRIEFEDAVKGADGKCAFYITDEQRKWRFAGVN